MSQVVSTPIMGWKEYDERFEDLRKYETKIHKCSECGEEKLCKYLPDPYLEEIHEEIVMKWLCYKCYWKLRDEI